MLRGFCLLPRRLALSPIQFLSNPYLSKFQRLSVSASSGRFPRISRILRLISLRLQRFPYPTLNPQSSEASLAKAKEDQLSTIPRSVVCCPLSVVRCLLSVVCSLSD